LPKVCRTIYTMNRDMIIDAYERQIAQTQTVAGRRRKARGGSKVEELAGLVNPYDDDGSMAFKKLRVSVMKAMATDLFGKAEIQELAALEKSDIDKEMAKLKKAQDILLKEKRRLFKESEERYAELEPDIKAQKRWAKIDSAKAYTDAAIYSSKNPYMATLSNTPTIVQEQTKAKVRAGPKITADYKFEAPAANLLLKEGEGRGRVSDYNKFFAKMRKDGYSPGEIGKAWKKL